MTSSDDLQLRYWEVMNKIVARECKKKLRNVGVTHGWFALLKGVQLAAGNSKQEVEAMSRSLASPEQQKFLHIFQIPGKPL